jgi:chromosome segregation ATPase
VLELNKQLKGGVINIYPLETIGLVNKKEVKMPPASNDVRSMIEFVRLKAQADQRLQTLIHNIFSKVVMVKEYARALQIAKEYSLTCVTPDLQVVYAGAFITKVGAARMQGENRVTLY